MNIYFDTNNMKSTIGSLEQMRKDFKNQEETLQNYKREMKQWGASKLDNFDESFDNNYIIRLRIISENINNLIKKLEQISTEVEKYNKSSIASYDDEINSMRDEAFFHLVGLGLSIDGANKYLHDIYIKDEVIPTHEETIKLYEDVTKLEKIPKGYETQKDEMRDTQNNGKKKGGSKTSTSPGTSSSSTKSSSTDKVKVVPVKIEEPSYKVDPVKPVLPVPTPEPEPIPEPTPEPTPMPQPVNPTPVPQWNPTPSYTGDVTPSGEAENIPVEPEIEILDDVVTPGNVYKIPVATISKAATTSTQSSSNSVIPVLAGISAAAAAGVGAKAYMDRKRNTDNDTEIDTEEWAEDLSDGDSYTATKNDNPEEINSNELVEDYSYEEPQVEKYGARSNSELSDMQ